MPLRKRPHCRTCGSPMAGHKRQSGIPVCPVPTPLRSSSPVRYPSEWLRELTPYPSPPRELTPYPSPPREVSPLPPPSSPIPSIEIPSHGLHRRVNPHWVDRPRDPPSPERPGMQRTTSLASTVPDDGQYMKMERDNDPYNNHRDAYDGHDNWENARAKDYCEDEDDARSVSSQSSDSMSSIVASVLHTSFPLASIFSTPRGEVTQVMTAARNFGLHFGIVKESPEQSCRCKRASDGGLENVDCEVHGRKWVVIGRSSSAVGHLSQARRVDNTPVAPSTAQAGPSRIKSPSPPLPAPTPADMPGSLPGVSPDALPPNTPQLDTTKSSGRYLFSHVVAAGAVGGLTVLFGLYYL